MSQRLFLLDVPFPERRAALFAGARWDAARKSWVYRGSVVPPALRRFRPRPYSLERFLEDEANRVRYAPSRPAREITPREHQIAAADLIQASFRIRRRGFLLADDVGLGKTISAWIAIAGLPGIDTVLIVCPLAVIAHWRQTIQWLGDAGKRVAIVNYDRLARLFEVPASLGAVRTRGRAKKGKKALRRVRSRKGIARFGTARDFDAIIFDESHRLRHPAAARAKLAAKLADHARFLLWMSATAGQNPLELSYLAPLLAQLTGSSARSLQDFEKWCAEQDLGVSRAAFGRWNFEGDDEACQRLERLLFGGSAPGGLRRRPQDIAGWPEINRQLMPMDLDGAQRALYEETWAEFRLALALAHKRKPGGKARAEAAAGLVAMLRFRQKSSLLRVGGTAEFVRMLRENGLQVAVSVAFVETMEALAKELEATGETVARIYGDQDPDVKEAQRMAFQTGKVSVVLFTVEEGISLHQGEYNDVPRAQIIHDLRWSAIQMAQIEGRCHRDGQFAQIYWTYAVDTIEERIAEIVLGRIRTMKIMQGDDVGTLEAVQRLLQEAAAEPLAA